MSGEYDARRHRAVLAVEAVALLEVEPGLRVDAAAALVGIASKSVYDAWRAVHPGEPPRGRQITEHMREAQRLPFETLCGVMLDHVPARGAALARDIFSDTRRAYGTVGERRLWRALARLVARGDADRRGILRTGATYIRRREAIS